MSSLKISLDALQQKAKERTVKTQTIEYDLETLVKKIKKNVIKLNPEYQRNHRWSNDVSSKLIESLILNIPIPLIYVSQDVDVDDEVDLDEISRYSVIDGQQRLTAIYSFFQNKFSLEGLEVLAELNGVYYSDLPPFLIRRLEERSIRCLRIDSTVDSQIKYDIFERLNSGSVKLEAQELRNATCRGPFKDLLKELSKNKIFLEIARLTDIRLKKMEDQELILRFFALTYEDGYKDYKGGFKNFLTTKMEHFNTLSERELSMMGSFFEESINSINIKFGDAPFSKYRFDEDSDTFDSMSKFNVAVFDSIVSNSKYINSLSNTVIDFKSIFKNKEYFAAVEGSVNDVSKLIARINIVKEFL